MSCITFSLPTPMFMFDFDFVSKSFFHKLEKLAHTIKERMISTSDAKIRVRHSPLDGLDEKEILARTTRYAWKK